LLFGESLKSHIAYEGPYYEHTRWHS